ncbi:MAG: transposase [Lewinellaceae bacterium]|nr:transposase [Lewinellaceae bacterium]
MAPRTLCPALGCLCQSAFSYPSCGGIPGTVHTQSTISNHRITNIDKQRVSFRYKDYRQDGKRKTMSLEGAEFLRRFCLHILPPGFRRMRHYGILSNFHKARALHAARIALKVEPAQPTQSRKLLSRGKKYWNNGWGEIPMIAPIVVLRHLYSE